MDNDGHHERIRIALRAQGLATEGSLQDCIMRLGATSGSKARKRKRDPPSSAEKTKTSSNPMSKCILKLHTLTPTTRALIAGELSVPNSSPESLAQCFLS